MRARVLLSSSTSGRIMAEGVEHARAVITEIKRRNLGGNMESIPGFNLAHNDAPTREPVASPSRAAPQAPVNESAPELRASVRLKLTPLLVRRRAQIQRQYKHLPVKERPSTEHVTRREMLRQAGKLPTRDIINQAQRRADGRALRAADGKVLKLPYTVRLKTR